MTREELIESLPGDLRPWGRLWLPVLLRWSEDQLTEFIMNASGMPWDTAYAKLVSSMTVDEKIAELKLRKMVFAKLNKENSQFIIDQRRMFFSVIAKVISSLIA